ncbi:MAG TPA: hypothetical protein VFI55_00175, partial [Mycobacterium sp.]|nr:hypothetical protein [Mycobacterium sp.]
FAHLLSAVLLALTASALFVAASRVIGREPALVATLVWWFPIAMTFPVGGPNDFSALSTEYLPILLIVASALVPREQLAARPWLFAVLGVLAGIAVGAKYQVGPLAAAWVAAQLIVLRPSVRRIAVSVLWWLVGAVLPAAAILLVMVASPATNWTIVEQIVSFLTSYTGSRSPLQRVGSTFAALIGPGCYLLVALAGLIWLSLHSERRSNVARAVLVTGGLTAMLGGPAGGVGVQTPGGFPHYLIILFGAVGLAFTMPVKPGAQLIPQRLSPTVLAGALATVAALVLVNGLITDRWAPLSPRGAAAAFSSNSVNRNPELARACPPGSRALVWGWKNELYVAQDWKGTIPYPNVLNLSMSPANRETGEPVIREGIERADCVVETTSICSGCPRLPAELTLPRYYPELGELIGRQFHTVPVGGCDGCTLYVRNVSSRASVAPRRKKKKCGGQRTSAARRTPR